MAPSATYQKYVNFEMKNRRICRQFIRGYVDALPFVKSGHYIKDLSKHLGRVSIHNQDLQKSIHMIKIETLEGVEAQIRCDFADTMHALAGSRFLDAVLFIEELEDGVLLVGFLMVATRRVSRNKPLDI